MNVLEIVLLSLLLVFPFLDILFEQNRSKNKVLEYLKTSLMLWVVTAFLIYLFSIGALSVNAPSYVSTSVVQNIIAGLICLALVSYTAFSAVSIGKNSEIKSQVLSAFESNGDSLNEMLPATRKEYLIFVMLVSVSAGICEELIFRWYLFSFLEIQTNWIAASVISSLLFGAWHLYLGWSHVAKSAAVGFILCLIYLYFESILLVIFLHIFMDIHAGTLAYAARKPTSHALIQT